MSNTKPICSIHQKEMRLGKFGYFCATPISTKADGSKVWCAFKVENIVDSQTSVVPQNQTPSQSVDWDKIAQGKVRCSLVQALITKRGLEEITPIDIDQLEGWVSWIFTGKMPKAKTTEDLSDDELEKIAKGIDGEIV